MARRQDTAECFLGEARLAAGLSHQNIVQVYEVGRDGDSYFMAMEYLHGFDLELILARLRACGEAVPLQHALTIVAGAAAGLHYAHESQGPDGRPLGIIHRDVSPSNVVVTFDGAVKLIDFGIAKAEPHASRTLPGMVKGKVGYMSPEQCAGWTLDRRSDVFALGILLYELTTMQRPYAATDEHDLMTMVVTKSARPPSCWDYEYPPELEKIVLRALSRARESRYQTARAFLDDVETLAVSLGMPLSATGLGDFMYDAFGAVPEPWRAVETLDPVRDDDPTSVYFAAEPTDAADVAI